MTIAPSFVEIVDRACDRFLVARDRRRADDDRIAGDDAELLVIAHRHAREPAHRLALRTGRHHDDLLGRIRIDVFDLNHAIRRNAQMPEFGRKMHDVAQRASEKRDLAVEALGVIDNLLNARHVRGKRRNDDASFGAREKIFVNASPTIRSESVWPGRSAFVESESMQSTPSFPIARDRSEIGRLAVDRRLIEFEIAGVKNRSRPACAARARTRPRPSD